MPYLQLEVNESYPIEKKKLLAKTLGEIFSRLMEANVKRVTVTIRELGLGGEWRCTDGEPVAYTIAHVRYTKGPSAGKTS